MNSLQNLVFVYSIIICIGGNLACSSEPNEGKFDFEKATQYLQAGEYRKAERQFELALAEKPGDRDMSLLLAQARMGQMKFDQAEKALKSAFRQASDHPDFTLKVAQLYYDFGKYVEADSVNKQILTVAPQHLPTRFLQAQILFKEDKKADSIHEFIFVLEHSATDQYVRLLDSLGVFALRNQIVTRNNLANCESPKFTATGRKIIYLSDEPSRVSNFMLSKNLNILELSSRRERTLVGPRPSRTVQGKSETPSYFDVSPDGVNIVHTMMEDRTAGGVTFSYLYTLNLRSGHSMYLGDGTNPIYSPDGKKILFRGYSNDGLFIVNSDGSSRTRILSTSQVYDYSFSRDGKQVAYRRDRGKVGIINLDGTDNLELGEGDHITFLPNNTQVLIDGKSLFDLNTHVRTTVKGGLIPASWSPDTTKVAFYSGDDVFNSRFIIIKDRKQNLVFRFNGQHPRWSFDSKKIVCIINSEPHYTQQISVVDVESPLTRKVVVTRLRTLAHKLGKES